MGRRKIDIAYLTDDRVRKVTFCKRKGGLFKKADDLSKLCGVEVAVVIIAEKKTCEYASTDMNRILERYQTMQVGVVRDETSEIARLWTQLETQRREMEALTRELNHEKRQVEELRGASLMALAGMEAAETNQLPLTLPPFNANMTGQGILAPPIFAAPITRPLPTHAHASVPVPAQMQMPMPSMSMPANVAMPRLPNNIMTPAVSTKHEREADGNASDMSDDTAEVDSNSEGTAADMEPSLKRRRVEEDTLLHTQLPVPRLGKDVQEGDAIVTQLPVHMPVSMPVGTPPAATVAVPATMPAATMPAVVPAPVSMPMHVPVPVSVVD